MRKLMQIILVFTVIWHGASRPQSFRNNPACNTGMLEIFNWCEQAECKSNCTCLEKSRVCKQRCDLANCGLMFCSSPLTCHQSVGMGKRDSLRDPMPNIKHMIAHSPRAEQECNKGRCKLLTSLRYENLPTTTFQSCADGACGKMQSHADIAQQFCGNCKSMRCSGKHAINCTQYCVLGDCPDMTCLAKHCKQMCLHSSACTMSCGENTETCEQVCSHKSNCTLKCKGGMCKQSCKQANNCTIIDIRTPPTTMPSPNINASMTTITEISTNHSVTMNKNISLTTITTGQPIQRKMFTSRTNEHQGTINNSIETRSGPIIQTNGIPYTNTTIRTTDTSNTVEDVRQKTNVGYDNHIKRDSSASLSLTSKCQISVFYCTLLSATITLMSLCTHV